MLCNCAAGRALQGKATWYRAQRADDSRVQSPDDGLPYMRGERAVFQSILKAPLHVPPHANIATRASGADAGFRFGLSGLLRTLVIYEIFLTR
jgi:hypothetical protein